ncbi:MAG: hypothetical protein QGH39_09345, partial [Candidatus Thermoplasmatota archaeon]|nr:hypothetical protein [Candidatus Thermoplasmatota archaeon]
MDESDEFRTKVTKTMEILTKTKKFKDYLDKEFVEMEGYLTSLAADGVDVSASRKELESAKDQFKRCRGMKDYIAVGNRLNKAKNTAHNIDLKVQEIIATVEQSLTNIKKYSELGMDMKKPLRLLAALRSKMKHHDHEAAMLYASQAWTLTEDIYQRYSQISTYLDELVRRNDQCRKLEIENPEMPDKLDVIKVHIKANDLDNAYKEMESFTKLLDISQTEYVNKLIQDSYYEISLQPDIIFSNVQETLSQAEYAVYNADFFTAIDLAQKAGPMIEGSVKEYQKTLNKVENVSSRLYLAKNLGVNVYQAESILGEANRMLLASDFKMAEEYARQSSVELDIVKDEIDWRQRSNMENMYANVRNALMALNGELQQDRSKGVDIVDAENLVEKIIEKMERAKTMDDYKKIQDYITATYSALSRARARHSRKEQDKREGGIELKALRERLKNFEKVCMVPKEVRDHLEKATNAYKKGKAMDVKREVGQIEQFFKEMEMKEIDIDVNIHLLEEAARVEDWVPAELTIKNNSNTHIKDIMLKVSGVVDQKGFRKIKEIKGQASQSERMKLRFQNLGQNRLTFATRGVRTMDGRAFQLKEKTNVFVGSREEFFDE